MTLYLIGTSGWHYDHWRERFYPPDLPKPRWLEFYGRHFSTLEINSSFYHLPTENAFARWRDSSPAGFVFAVKVSRFITHIKKLADCEEALQTFFARARVLGEKLGPCLYQLPPSMGRDDERLKAFVGLLPPDLRHVFEFRNDSWFDPGIYKILRDRNIALCIYDMGSRPTPCETTADFSYIRFHGSASRRGCYSDVELLQWAERIARMEAQTRVVYIYFNNDAQGFALKNAQRLGEILTPSTPTP